MDNFPINRTIRVSNERYTLEHLLSLQRCAFTRKILGEFPSEFSVLAETEFASFVSGAGCLHLEKLLHTHWQMQSSSQGKPSSPWTPSTTPQCASPVSSSAASQSTAEDTDVKEKEKEGSVTFKILLPFHENQLPQCFFQRKINIQLENYLLNNDGTVRTEEDSKEAIEFLWALASRKFIDYCSQAILGVTDPKEAVVDLPPPTSWQGPARPSHGLRLPDKILQGCTP